jgi:2-polyprenyl-3-methyl-5-hydroxy-6-metoxy-1,4-benzoquinol methylase
VSYLEQNEPRFHAYWKGSVDLSDPQHERWVELEGGQLAAGEANVEKVARFFPVAGLDVLDVGCQWGATCVALARAGARAAGIDVDSDLIEGALIRADEQRVDVDYREGAAESIPFPESSFDLVILHDVMEHVRSHRETIGDIARVLRPGGGLWLQAPNRLSPQLLRRDPHYLMSGISILPPRLGALYVTRVRGYPSYDVGTFPIASRLERMLTESGMEIIGSSRLDAATGSARSRRLNRLNSTALLNLRRYFFIAARRLTQGGSGEPMTGDPSLP